MQMVNKHIKRFFDSFGDQENENENHSKTHHFTFMRMLLMVKDRCEQVLARTRGNWSHETLLLGM